MSILHLLGNNCVAPPLINLIHAAHVKEDHLIPNVILISSYMLQISRIPKFYLAKKIYIYITILFKSLILRPGPVEPRKDPINNKLKDIQGIQILTWFDHTFPFKTSLASIVKLPKEDNQTSILDAQTL